MKQLNLFDKAKKQTQDEKIKLSIVKKNGKVSTKEHSATKYCPKCNQTKPASEFYVDRLLLYYKCKSCCKIYRDQLNKAKENAPPKPERCDCCDKDMTGEAFYCDHYPDTEDFRGWVCRYCNEAAGNVGDCYKGATKLFNYLYSRKR
jgi:hypothetical protein